MPRWGEHLYIANKIYDKISDKIKIDKNLFLFGNILPDIQDGYLINDVSNIIAHEKNHYDFDNNKTTYENFYDLNHDKINNPVVLGYYLHLMVDYLWNKEFDKKCIRDENGIIIGYYDIENKKVSKNRENAISNKQMDFEIFENYINDKYDIEIPVFDEKLLTCCNLIDIININVTDIKKSLEFINESKKEIKYKDLDKLKIFKKEDFEQYIDLTINEFMKNFNDKLNTKDFK